MSVRVCVSECVSECVRVRVCECVCVRRGSARWGFPVSTDFVYREPWRDRATFPPPPFGHGEYSSTPCRCQPASADRRGSPVGVCGPWAAGAEVVDALMPSGTEFFDQWPRIRSLAALTWHTRKWERTPASGSAHP